MPRITHGGRITVRSNTSRRAPYQFARTDSKGAGGPYPRTSPMWASGPDRERPPWLLRRFAAGAARTMTAKRPGPPSIGELVGVRLRRLLTVALAERQPRS